MPNLCTAKTWEVSYRYKNSLSLCHVWASTEEQAEKKFKARKEFEYDPEYDRDEDEGNIRSIYVYQPPRPKTVDRPKMDRLIRFCLPIEIQTWLKQYQAPGYEYAFAKDIPNTVENHKMTEKLAKIIPLRRKYRGSSTKSYRRPRDFCHKEQADRFALYFK